MTNWINIEIICNCLIWWLLKYWEEMHLPVILNQNNPTKGTSYGMKARIGMGLETIILGDHILHHFCIAQKISFIKCQPWLNLMENSKQTAWFSEVF